MNRTLLELLPPAETGRLAVHATGVDTDRATLVSMVEEFAGRLVAAGLQPGQPVGVSLPNGAELVAMLFAVWKAGGVYVPINPRLTETERAHVLASTRPSVGITSRQSPSIRR